MAVNRPRCCHRHVMIAALADSMLALTTSDVRPLPLVRRSTAPTRRQKGEMRALMCALQERALLLGKVSQERREVVSWWIRIGYACCCDVR